MDKPSENSGFLNDKFSGQEVNPPADLWDGIAAGTGTGPLAQAFGGYESPPSPAVWNGIAATLHPERRRAVVWWWSSAASVLLLLGVSSFFLINHSVSTSHFVLNQPDVNPVENRLPASVDNQDEDSSTPFVSDDIPEENPSNQDEAPNAQRSKHDPTGDLKNSLALEEPEPSETGGIQGTQDQVPDSPGIENIAFLNSLTGLVQQDLPVGNLIFFPSIPPPPGNNSGSESEHLFALAGSFSPFINQPNTSMTDASINSLPSADLTENEGFGGTDTPVVNVFTEASNYDNSNTEYSPPLSFGIQFIALNHKRISLGTGVEITTLGGKLTSTYGQYSTEQQFSQQYIGVPLFAQMDWLRRKKFTLYTKTGGVFDIGWKSNTQVNDFDGENLTKSYTYSFRPGNQARMINSLGVRSKLTDSVSFFIEGNGSIMLYQANSNLWSGRKFWPSMGVGIVVGF